MNPNSPPGAEEGPWLPALPPWAVLLRLARKEVERTQASLPPELADARELPVLYERLPGHHHGAGVEPDTLGLFMGPSRAEALESHGLISSHIVLFLHNLWDMTDGREKEFCEEVRVTYLHELGHYLGLDEDDLEGRGLE